MLIFMQLAIAVLTDLSDTSAYWYFGDFGSRNDTQKSVPVLLIMVWGLKARFWN